MVRGWGGGELLGLVGWRRTLENRDQEKERERERERKEWTKGERVNDAGAKRRMIGGRESGD
jgi:hypothetical protein